MEEKIVLGEKVSTYSFYSEVLEKFLKIYIKDKKCVPIVDMRKTKYISPAAIPVLLAFGDYLRRLYARPINILVEEESELLNFLICSNFLKISENLKIFSFEDKILDKWNYKPLRSIHKISNTLIKYDDADRITNLVQRRNYINDCLVDKSQVLYEEILRDTNQLPESIIDTTIKSIAEIETNAIMYSKAYSFTYVASDKYGTKISIADTGEGFEKSFFNAEREMLMVKMFNNIESKFRNYLIIMSALNYSYEKHEDDKREDLWSLRTNVVNSNGIFKIHYRDTQVIFSCNSCRNCTKIEGKKDISECVRCLLARYNEETYSPIKLFKLALQGVRVEIAINRGE